MTGKQINKTNNLITIFFKLQSKEAPFERIENLDEMLIALLPLGFSV